MEDLPKPTGLAAGMKVRFDYLFAGQANCNHPDLDARTGQMVTLEEKTDDWTEDTPTGPIEVEEWSIRFADGHLGYAHSDGELTL